MPRIWKKGTVEIAKNGTRKREKEIIKIAIYNFFSFFPIKTKKQ